MISDIVKYVRVRSGIRTHAYKSRLRPERSALDRSAILTTLPICVKCLLLIVNLTVQILNAHPPCHVNAMQCNAMQCHVMS